jgi:hypothetical protein
MMWIFGDICLDDEEIWIQVFQCSSFETWILPQSPSFMILAFHFIPKKHPENPASPFFAKKGT